MGFDKGTITNGTVVALSLLAVVGLLIAGATPAVAQSNETADDEPPGFDFDIENEEDFSNFGFSGDNSAEDESDFSGIGDEDSSFDFSGIGGDDGDAPDFGGIGGDDSDGPDFGGIGEDGEAPDFGGIGEDGETPDFDGIGGDDGDDEQDGDDGEEPAPADFQVSNLDAPSEATVGSTISVSADVTNEGGQEDARSVAFGIDTDDDGDLEEIDSQDETLASGASTTVTFDVDTSDLAAGTYTHGVSSANDTDTAQITLNAQEPDQPVNFQIQSAETNSPVTEGDSITVDVTVENTGDEAGTQRVAVSVLGSTNQPVETLAGGESRVVSVSVQTIAGDAGTYDLTVETNDDSYANTVTVTAPGATGTVEGTVSDAGGSAIDGATVSADGQSTTTSADGSYSLTLDGGDYTVEASADGYDASSQDVSVTAGETTTADFTLSEVDTTGQVAGTVANVSSGGGVDGATISAGGQSTTTSADGSYSLTLDGGDYTVEATAEGYETSSQEVTVTAGESETANFNLQPTDSDSGVPDYQSFTAYAESGYLQVGNTSYRSELPDCPNGVPENESKGCVKFTADLNPETGEYTVTPENFQFPPIPFEETALETVIVNNTATDTITGNLDIESGSGSFNAPIFSYLQDPGLSDGCGLEVNVEGTTGQSGNLTGDTGALQPNGTARATLVDGTFSIPETTFETCGFQAGTVNDDVGLPAGPGKNEIVQNIYIEFSEEPASDNPDAPSND